MNKKKGKLKLRKGRAAAAAAGAAAVCALGWLVYRMNNPIIFKSANPRVELGEKYDPMDNILFVYWGSKEEVQTAGTVNELRCGEYEIDYLYQSKTFPVKVTVSDTKGPVLVLKDVTVNFGDEVDAESFVESCTDPSKVSISITNPSALDTELSKVMVEITAMDEYGNKTVKSAMLTRLPSTKEQTSAQPLPVRTVEAGSEFVPLDLNAVEGFGPYESVECDLSGLDMNTPGSYTVRYTMKDATGKVSHVVETISVAEPQPAQE
ncbi:MAG: hypothetical protein HUJ54_08995 [Erysipelotrichaceae bacterium]|nr:hypothetical protein [Erysipelotrichaceae bacterium]